MINKSNNSIAKIIVIHGDNEVEAKNYLFDLIQQFKTENFEIKRINQINFQFNYIEQILGENNLFVNKTILLFEYFLCQPLKKIKPFLDLFNKTQKTLIFFDKKKIKETTLKKIQINQIKEFKINNLLFQFLDSLKPHSHKPSLLTLYHQILEYNDAHFIFLMIVRQFKLLILTKKNKLTNQKSFMQQKLHRQANCFQSAQLEKLTKELLHLDYQLKKTLNLLDIKKELDIFLLKM